MFNATLNNISVISCRPVFLVEETGVPVENYWPVANHWQTLSDNVVHLALIGIRTHNISSDRSAVMLILTVLITILLHIIISVTFHCICSSGKQGKYWYSNSNTIFKWHFPILEWVIVRYNWNMVESSVKQHGLNFLLQVFSVSVISPLKQNQSGQITTLSVTDSGKYLFF
jgi:hypothetical protein